VAACDPLLAGEVSPPPEPGLGVGLDATGAAAFAAAAFKGAGG